MIPAVTDVGVFDRPPNERLLPGSRHLKPCRRAGTTRGMQRLSSLTRKRPCDQGPDSFQKSVTMSGKGVPRFVHVFNALSMLTAMQAAMDISKRKRGAVRLLFVITLFLPESSTFSWRPWANRIPAIMMPGFAGCGGTAF